MALASKLLSGIPELENCASQDAAHIASGRGDYIKRLQQALKNVNGADIVDDGAFGPLTGDAIFAFKSKWKILGPGETTPDRIVGRKTIAKLDDLEADFEQHISPGPDPLTITGMAGVHVANMHGQDIVTSYYRNCGLETIGPARVSTAGPMTYASFEDLIDQLNLCRQPHQIIVNHGNADDGLLIRFSRETAFNETGSIIGELSGLADMIAAKGSVNKQDPSAIILLQIAKQMGVSQDVVIRVAGKLVPLRQKRFVYHFRACNMKDPELVRTYKRAFGGQAISYHGCRLLFLRIKPAQAKPGISIVDLNMTSTAKKRYRTTIDINFKLHPIIMGVEDVDGHTRIRDQTVMQVKTTQEIQGWAEWWIDRWAIANPTEFVIPVMWDNQETTFHFPLELGWRAKLAFV